MPVRAVEFDGLHFVALTSSAALREEGTAMRHCIASHEEACRTSSLRVYSVRQRKSGARLTTVTVVYAGDRDYWYFDEINLDSSVPNRKAVHPSTGSGRTAFLAPTHWVS